MKNTKLYGYRAVDDFLVRMEKKGYAIDQIDEGVLGSGDWLLTSPDNRPSYVVLEIALTSWTSAHRIYSSKELSSADMWEIAQRFAREAEYSREQLDEALGISTKRPEITDEFARQKVSEGYECIVTDAVEDGAPDYFLVSPDTRPSYTRTTLYRAPHEYEYVTHSSDGPEAWNVLTMMACTAMEMRYKLEDAA